MIYPHPLTQVHAAEVKPGKWECALLYADGARASSVGTSPNEAFAFANRIAPIPPKPARGER